MLLLLHGEDTFLSRQKLREFVVHYRARNPSGLNFVRIDARTTSFEKFVALSRGQSLFGGRIFCILEHVFDDAIFAQKLLEEWSQNSSFYVPLYSPIILLLFEPKRVGEDTPLFQYVKTHGKVQECARPPRPTKIIQYMIRAAGIIFASDGERFFLFCVGDDLWRAKRELEKLAAWNGNKKIITKQDLEKYINAPSSYTVFSLIDGFCERSKIHALKCWYELLEQGEEPFALLGALIRHIKNLFFIRYSIDQRKKISDIVRTGGIHPFVARKSIAQAKYFTQVQLAQLYERFFWLDIEVKSGRRGINEGYEGIVSSLL